jgi:hypothetical protein
MLWTGAAIAMAATALPGAGQASDGTISFIGAVAAPSCTLIVRDVDLSRLIDSISYAGRTAAGCDAAVDATKTGSASMVSIYFETVSSIDHESDGIISIVYK